MGDDEQIEGVARYRVLGLILVLIVTLTAFLLRHLRW